MTTPRDIDALWPDNTVDTGCAAGFDVLHSYVEEELAGIDPANSQPGLGAHTSTAARPARNDSRPLTDPATGAETTVVRTNLYELSIDAA